MVSKRNLLLLLSSGKKKVPTIIKFKQYCQQCIENCEKIIEEIKNSPNDFSGHIIGVVHKCKQLTQLLLDNMDNETISFQKQYENAVSIWKESIEVCENYSDNELFKLLIDSCEKCITTGEKLFA